MTNQKEFTIEQYFLYLIDNDVSCYQTPHDCLDVIEIRAPQDRLLICVNWNDYERCPINTVGFSSIFSMKDDELCIWPLPEKPQTIAITYKKEIKSEVLRTDCD